MALPVVGGAPFIVKNFTFDVKAGSSVVYALPETFKLIQLLLKGITCTSSVRIELSDDGGATYGALRQVSDGASGAKTGSVWIDNCNLIGVNKNIDCCVGFAAASGIYFNHYVENVKTGILTHIRFTTGALNFSAGTALLRGFK